MADRRCDWATEDDPLYVAYHDDEWGVPCRDDQALFEFLVLEGAQAGLSWRTILHKRAHYQKVYRGFDPEVVARFDARKKARLLDDAGIVRNRLKVEASVTNAKAWLALADEMGSPAEHLWSFVDGTTVQNRFQTMADVPATTEASDAMSKDLKRRGFKFVGSTICYAFMQAVGMVNDHLVTCPRWKPLSKTTRALRRR